MQAKYAAELNQVRNQVASTREALLRLNASIQSDRGQFEEWQKAADDGFDRCMSMAGDVLSDFGIGALTDRYDTIYDLAQRLPGKPKDVIEKYRYLASLGKRLEEAKASNDFAGLAERENKSQAEIYETMRDGVGQIVGLFGLDKKFPAVAMWKYGSLACDMAYNLTELRQGWKSVNALEKNNAGYAAAVKKLSGRMKALIDREKELRQKIDAGKPVSFRTPDK